MRAPLIHTKTIRKTTTWRPLTYSQSGKKIFKVHKIIANKKHTECCFILPKPSLGAHTIHGFSFCLRIPLSKRSKYVLFKSFSKILLTTKEKTKRAVAFSCRSLPNILKYKNTDKSLKQSEKKIPSGTYWKSQLICMKVFFLIVLQNKHWHAIRTTFDKSRLITLFLTQLGKYRKIMQFQISSRMKSW